MEDIGLKFLGIVRSRSRRVLGDLSPDELRWVEFRGRDRKVVHMQSFVDSQKILDGLALMNGVAIPNQDDGAGDLIQNLL